MDNPMVLTTAGQGLPSACRVLAVIWVGTTTVGDKAELSRSDTGKSLWKGQTNDVNTYLGANFGTDGVPCPSGFTLSQISSASLYVYLREA